MRATRQVLYINVLFTRLLGQYCLCPFSSPRVSPSIYTGEEHWLERRKIRKQICEQSGFVSFSFFFFSSIFLFRSRISIDGSYFVALHIRYNILTRACRNFDFQLNRKFNRSNDDFITEFIKLGFRRELSSSIFISFFGINLNTPSRFPLFWKVFTSVYGSFVLALPRQCFDINDWIFMGIMFILVVKWLNYLWIMVGWIKISE